AAEDEENRRPDDERRRQPALALVQPRRDEQPELQKDHRRGQENPGQERHLHVQDERRRQARVGELVARRQHLQQRRLEIAVDLVAGARADEEAGQEGHDRDEQPLAQLVEVIEERHLRQLALLVVVGCERGGGDGVVHRLLGVLRGGGGGRGWRGLGGDSRWLSS